MMLPFSLWKLFKWPISCEKGSRGGIIRTCSALRFLWVIGTISPRTKILFPWVVNAQYLFDKLNKQLITWCSASIASVTSMFTFGWKAGFAREQVKLCKSYFVIRNTYSVGKQTKRFEKKRASEKHTRLTSFLRPAKSCLTTRKIYGIGANASPISKVFIYCFYPVPNS